MRKLLAAILCLILILVFAGCGNSSKYEEAETALNSGDYNTAIILLEELVADEYEGSEELLLEAKYQYVKANFDRDDSRTVTYLETLLAEGYADSQDLYDELYSWKVEIAINTKKQSSIHYDEISVSDNFFKFYYFNFRTHGGPPEGEYKGKYEIVFSDGRKTSDTYYGRDNNYYYSVMLSGTQNPRGKTTFNVYGEDGELLASKTCDIS